MSHHELANAVKQLTESLQLLDYHLGNDAVPTVIRHHARQVKAAMKVLDRRIDVMRSAV